MGSSGNTSFYHPKDNSVIIKKNYTVTGGKITE
jgi:hypothetical protein